MRGLASRNVPPTEYLPGMYGPGQTHRDAPLSDRSRLVWNVVIAVLLGVGVLLFVLAAVFDWGS
jgi:hypothetical protein